MENSIENQDETTTEVVDEVQNEYNDQYDEPEFINSFDNLDVPDEMKAKWKEEHSHLFRIFFIDTTYIYRNFTYTEYKTLRKDIRTKFGNNVEEGDEAFKEAIQDICVIWPKDYKERRDIGKPSPIPGGIPFLLGDYILAASGFADSIVPDVITANGNP